MKRTRSTKGTPVNTAEQRLSYQGTQSSVESITIEIQDTPAVYFTFKYTWILIYMTEGQKKKERKKTILCKDLCALFTTITSMFTMGFSGGSGYSKSQTEPPGLLQMTGLDAKT